MKESIAAFVRAKWWAGWNIKSYLNEINVKGVYQLKDGCTIVFKDGSILEVSYSQDTITVL
jgi:hypothetical protein